MLTEMGTSFFVIKRWALVRLFLDLQAKYFRKTFCISGPIGFDEIDWSRRQ